MAETETPGTNEKPPAVALQKSDYSGCGVLALVGGVVPACAAALYLAIVPVTTERTFVTKLVCPIDGVTTEGPTAKRKVRWSRWTSPPEKVERRSQMCEEHAAEVVDLTLDTTRQCSACQDEFAKSIRTKRKVKRGELPGTAKPIDDSHRFYQASEVVTDAAFCLSRACKCMAKRGWDRAACEAVTKGHVYVGMTAEQARSAWGPPNDVNRTTFATHTREQWVYDGGYLYFENGVLVTIQN